MWCLDNTFFYFYFLGEQNFPKSNKVFYMLLALYVICHSKKKAPTETYIDSIKKYIFHANNVSKYNNKNIEKHGNYRGKIQCPGSF